MIIFSIESVGAILCAIVHTGTAVKLWF